MDEPSAGLAPLVVQQVFDLVRRIRAEGLTVLIVEQNVQQVLEVVDRAYLLEVGAIKLAGTAAELKGNSFIRKAYMGLYGLTMDIYLLEAIINGLLLGGVLALLALGLNLIFGVIDVVWICLCRPRHVRHVRHLLPLRRTTCRCRSPALIAIVASRASASSCTCSSSRPVLELRADQPAAGDRRPAVLPAELCDAAVRHRLPQYRRPACRSSRSATIVCQLRAPDRLRRRARSAHVVL